VSSPKYERKILDIPTPFSEVLILWIRAICRTKISSPDPELATGWPSYPTHPLPALPRSPPLGEIVS
jgi:hypothetical protein